MSTTINERLLDVISVLYKGNKSTFASAIGVTPSVIDNITGKRQGKPSFEVLNKISAIKEINIEWLITGQGDMLKDVSNTTSALARSTEKPTTSHSQFYRLDKYTPGTIPLVSTQAVGGFSGSDFSISDDDVIGYYVIPGFQNKGIDFMIRITGDSMAPRLWGGDIIACSIIRNPNFIQWNKTHLIATRDQGLLVKRLRKSTDPDCILAVSNNPDYDPFDIPKQDILGIARVVGVIHLE